MVEVVKALNDLDHLEAGDSLEKVPSSLKNNRIKVTNKVWESMHFKKSILRQKSRYKCIKEGDSNTKIFHKSMQERFRRNIIVGLNKKKGRLV